ncbi:MAG: hypothetical protein JSV91_10020 [Phycisphaerales bacterium]|nr:MAG: hypothetical protein JSV91_10020 [Phycisphaerales bacterium]
MRIELRDERRQRMGRIDVDPALRPTRVKIVDSDREVFLNWETALDDGGRLRRCVACGCTDLFAEKVFPMLTGVVVVLAFAGFVVGALGFFGAIRFAGSPHVLVAMSVILVLDVAILLFSRRRLVCYRCRSSFHGLPIARYYRSWDRSIAEGHPPPPSPPARQTEPLRRASEGEGRGPGEEPAPVDAVVRGGAGR